MEPVRLMTDKEILDAMQGAHDYQARKDLPPNHWGPMHISWFWFDPKKGLHSHWADYNADPENHSRTIREAVTNGTRESIVEALKTDGGEG